MKLRHPIFKNDDPKIHSLLDRRYAERVPIRCQVSYSEQAGARIVTEDGTLKDISKTGCKILGATTSSLGSSLSLLLDFADGKAPLRLTDATVSWLGEDSFAVRFPKLSEDERRRLQEVIWKNVSLSSLDDQRTAFRMV